MADISKININDSSEYNIKDTTARNGLTDRPTSFVGTRSGWNALPVATQVRYSLVCLKGEGIYKNNGTELELIADVGMPESYPANNVMMSDGETSVEDALDEMTSNITSSTALSFNTEYTASSDGYVRGIVNAGSNKFVQIMLYLNSTGTYGAVAKVGDSPNEGQVCTLYVRKGMKYKIQCSSTNDATCSFITLS